MAYEIACPACGRQTRAHDIIALIDDCCDPATGEL